MERPTSPPHLTTSWTFSSPSGAANVGLILLVPGGTLTLAALILPVLISLPLLPPSVPGIGTGSEPGIMVGVDTSPSS